MHLTSLVVAPLVHFRYLIISLPAAYLLVSRSITALPVRPWMQALVGTLLIGLCFYHLVFVKDYYSKGQPGKAQFREAVAFVVKQEPLYEDSLIIGAVPSLDYYFDKNASARRVDAQGGSKWHDPDHKIAVTEMIRARNPKHLWFISEHESIDIDFVYFLDDHDFTLMLLKRFVGADVWLFRNDNKVDRLEKS
jgi:hypothetical protein